MNSQYRKENNLAGPEKLKGLIVQDKIKEVVGERADHIGFEGHSKDFRFYCNGKASEGFEQNSNMVRLMLSRIILGAVWRIGYTAQGSDP